MSKLKNWTSGALLQIRHSIASIRRPKRLLVIHIAKTGGTSLRRMLQEEYGERLVYPGDFHLLNLQNGYYPSGSEMLRDYARMPPHNVMVGHFTAAMADMLPRRYKTATFLREPIQRSLSTLGHFSRTLKLPVPVLLEDPKFMADNIIDFQTRVLGADGVCDPAHVETANEEMLARALRRLKTLDFVGLTERFAESCAIFDIRFRTRISKSIRREAVHRPQGSELSEFIPQITALVQRDRVLYKMATAGFEAAS